MSGAPVFLDTNILVYAFDRDAGDKHRRAKNWIHEFWDGGIPPQLSIQVLQELHVTLVRKGYPIPDSAALVSDFMNWPVVANSLALMQAALRIQARYQASFWDANIIAAAAATGCTIVWSEDLNAPQTYGGVTVINPFEEGV